MRTKLRARRFRHGTDSPVEVSVQSTAELQLDDGCTVEISTPAHRGVPAGAPERIEEIEREQMLMLSNILKRLRLTQPGRTPSGAGTPEVQAGETATARTGRERLLAETCPGTEKVLDLIDELATGGLEWAWHPVLGIRGRTDGERPEVERCHGARSLAWGDGTLCPLAAAIETRVDGTTETPDRRNALEATVGAPMETARAEFARANGLDEAPATFTMESAAWGLLVLASDEASLDAWIADQEIDATSEQREMLVKTLNLIKGTMLETLVPGSPKLTIREPVPARATV